MWLVWAIGFALLLVYLAICCVGWRWLACAILVGLGVLVGWVCCWYFTKAALSLLIMSVGLLV